MEAGLLDPILEAVVESDLTVRKEALWALTNLTKSAPESVVRTVLESGGLKVLGSAVCYSDSVEWELQYDLLHCLEQVLEICPSRSQYLEALSEECRYRLVCCKLGNVCVIKLSKGKYYAKNQNQTAGKNTSFIIQSIQKRLLVSCNPSLDLYIESVGR